MVVVLALSLTRALPFFSLAVDPLGKASGAPPMAFSLALVAIGFSSLAPGLALVEAGCCLQLVATGLALVEAGCCLQLVATGLVLVEAGVMIVMASEASVVPSVVASWCQLVALVVAC